MTDINADGRIKVEENRMDNNTLWIQVYTPNGCRASITLGFDADGKPPSATDVEKMVTEAGYQFAPTPTAPVQKQVGGVPDLTFFDNPPATPTPDNAPVSDAPGLRKSLANGDGLLIEIGKKDAPTYQIVQWANQQIDYDNKTAQQYKDGAFIGYRIEGAIEVKEAKNGNVFANIPTNLGTLSVWRNNYNSEELSYEWRDFERDMYSLGHSSDQLLPGFRSFHHGIVVLKVAHKDDKEYRNYYGLRALPEGEQEPSEPLPKSTSNGDSPQETDKFNAAWLDVKNSKKWASPPDFSAFLQPLRKAGTITDDMSKADIVRIAVAEYNKQNPPPIAAGGEDIPF